MHRSFSCTAHDVQACLLYRSASRSHIDVLIDRCPASLDVTLILGVQQKTSVGPQVGTRSDATVSRVVYFVDCVERLARATF